MVLMRGQLDKPAPMATEYRFDNILIFLGMLHDVSHRSLVVQQLKNQVARLQKYHACV